MGGFKDFRKKLIKNIEDEAYDDIANTLGQLIKAAEQDEKLKRTIYEFFREMRQRGNRGPKGPDHTVERNGTKLDNQTANGHGPVIMMWWRGQDVPDDVWPLLVRDWVD